MNLEDLKEQVAESTGSNENTGKTNVRLDGSVVSDAKGELGVGTNKALAPFIEASIYRGLGMDDKAEAKAEEFINQFDEDSE